MSKTETISRAEAMLREASGRMMNTRQVGRLRHAFRLERGTNAERREAGEICQEIEAELRGGITETVALERARGGEVEEGSGPIRMVDRDGLHALLGVKDGLTTEQYDAGMAFREGWEVRSPLGSAMGQESSGAPHDNDKFVRGALTRAKKLQRLGTIEREVAVRCLKEPASLQMLRAVAGDGKNLRVFGAGRAFYRHLAALKRALDVAAEVVGVAK